MHDLKQAAKAEYERFLDERALFNKGVIRPILTGLIRDILGQAQSEQDKALAKGDTNAVFTAYGGRLVMSMLYSRLESELDSKETELGTAFENAPDPGKPDGGVGDPAPQWVVPPDRTWDIGPAFQGDDPQHMPQLQG